jgi:DNA (cytosine-5)-methyltransferase 1
VANTINEGSQRWVSGRQDSERENFNRHTGCGSTDSIDWLYCRDEKYRPIKSGIKPLVDGIARGVVYSCDSVITPNASAEARTIRLKGYGNAIVAPVATEFIRATMEVIDGVKTL